MSIIQVPVSVVTTGLQPALALLDTSAPIPTGSALLSVTAITAPSGGGISASDASASYFSEVINTGTESFLVQNPNISFPANTILLALISRP